MNTFLAFTTLIALCLLSSHQSTQSLEKQAIGDTQQTLASELDANLPKLPFADWVEKVVGSGTGVIWQLSECGEVGETALNQHGDIRACVNVNTILPDGRRVILMISVGTFKKGLTNPPTFHFGVIEQNGELRPIRRLRDLPGLLLDPEKLAKRPPVELPRLNITQVSPRPNNGLVERDQNWNAEELGQLIPIEDPPPPPPPPSPPTPISVGDAVVKVQPQYPTKARRVSAVGMVDVQVTISPEGRVTEAKAISGHPLLREAAEEAAIQWVFKPAIANGAPVSTQIILTFRFKAPGGDDD